MNLLQHNLWRDIPLTRLVIGITAVVLLLWSLIPITRGIFNAGVMASVPASLVILAACIFWNPLRSAILHILKYQAGRVILILAFSVVFVFFILFLIVSCFMLHAAARKPAKQATVVVLGAQINGDSPSIMLAARLEAAAHYLKENEDSVCIVSGGQGSDEICSEAEVMYRYLVGLGIEPSRIYQENRSKNTEENIRYSMEIVKQEGLNSNVVIATQEFHQYRAQSMAKKEGFASVGPCTCSSPIYLLECYWVREFAAICRFWTLGY